MTKPDIQSRAMGLWRDHRDFELAVALAIEIHNRALEQAAKLCDDGDAMPGMAGAIRRLKVPE